MKLFIQLGWYFRQEKYHYSGAILLMLAISLLQLLPPRLVGKIIDGVSSMKWTPHKTLLSIGAILLIALIIYLLRGLWYRLLFGASHRLAVRLRDDLYCQLSRQPPGFYLNYRTGDLMARATNDVDRVVMAAGQGVMMLVDSLITGIAVLVVMGSQFSWLLTLLSLLPMPLMAWLIKRYGDQLYLRFKHSQAAFSALNDHTQQSLTHIRMIKGFGLEQSESVRFARLAAESSRQNMHVARVDARYDPTIYIAIAIANLLAIGGGSWLVLHDRLTLGELTSFVMYLGLMIWPILAMAWMFNIVERGSAAYARINTLLRQLPAVRDGQLSIPAGRAELRVDIDYFHYPQQARNVLQNIHFRLQPGQVLGLCGMTGSGKSSLLALLQRQFDINKGEICYSGLPLHNLRLDEWRARLAVVSQTPFLFSDTVASNIMLGRPEASQQQIEQVAHLACIHNDIMRLPQGYQTEIGERGVMLSGGQKQRIAIARALLLEAEILLLDDALSAVDGRTELQILHNLHRWGVNRTIVISAHRLSALSEANEILVLQEGQIMQRGTHSELLNQPGWYSDMHSYQQMAAALSADEGEEGQDA